MVLDFANEADAIRETFEPCYEHTILSEDSAPNLLHDLEPGSRTTTSSATRSEPPLRRLTSRSGPAPGPMVTSPSATASSTP
jgi:hypothetical protein